MCVYGIINIGNTFGIFSILKKNINIELLIYKIGYGNENDEELDHKEIVKNLCILYHVGYIIYTALMGNYFYTTYKCIMNLVE